MPPVYWSLLAFSVLTLVAGLWGKCTATVENGQRSFKTLPLMITVAGLVSAIFIGFYALVFQQTSFYPEGSSSTISTGSARVPLVTTAAALFGGILFVAFTVLKYKEHINSIRRLGFEQSKSSLDKAQHFSERFAKAAEMLGSSHAATRLGGVYTLAALTDEWQANRQQCVDLLCGYLRSPIGGYAASEASENIKTPPLHHLPSPPTPPRNLLPRPSQVHLSMGSGAADFRDKRLARATTYVNQAARDEMEVRRAIVASIKRGTSRSPEAEGSWSDLHFDLSKTYLADVDLSSCVFREMVNFNYSIFTGNTNFRDVEFHKNAQFDGCLFHGRAWFSGARFRYHAWFRASEFAKEARFGRVAFQGGMFFQHARFSEPPHFNANELGQVGSSLTDNAFANWDCSEIICDPDEDSVNLSACMDDGSLSIWRNFVLIQEGYTILCGGSHPGREFTAKHPRVIE